VKCTAYSKVERILSCVYREIVELDWSVQIPGLDPIHEDGRRKYQGFLLAHYPHQTQEFCLRPYGELLDPPKSQQSVIGLITALRAYPGCWASVEIRQYPSTVAGAVRNTKLDYWGIVGLPELANHLLLASVLECCRELPSGRFSQLVDVNYPGIWAACRDTRLSVHKYHMLEKRLYQIVLSAAM
jgi:hypothetical protein